MLTPMLNDAGKLIGDFTIAKAALTTASMIWGSGRRRTIICAGSSSICRRTAASRSIRSTIELVGLSIAGPKSRELLQELTDRGRFQRGLQLHGLPRDGYRPCAGAWSTASTYTGDLGYEIWVAPDYQRRLYEDIMEAGEGFGLINFGMRALLSHAA